MLGLSAVSWGRLVLARSLALEAVELPLWARVAQWSLFGVFAGWAALSFWRLWREKPALSRLVPLALALHLCAAPALPLTSSDVFCNLAYGRVAATGRNPYTVPPGALPDGDEFRGAVYGKWAAYPTPYGPVVAWLDAAASRTGSLAGALAVFKLEMLAATLLAVMLGAAICRRRGDAGAFVLFGCNPLVAWELSGQAHNDALLVLGVTAFLLAALEERWWPALLGLALALWTKPAAVPLCGLVLLWQLRTAPIRAVMGAALALAIGAALYAPFWAGPATLTAILRELRGDPEHLTHSFTALVYELSGHRLVAYRVMQALSLALVAALALRGAMRAVSLETVLRGAALFYLAYGVVAAPWMQAWYISWIPPLLLLVPDAELREATAAWSALGLVQYAVPWHTATAVVVNGVPLYLLLRRYTAAPAGRPARS
jgi:hypothetical protein